MRERGREGGREGRTKTMSEESGRRKESKGWESIVEGRSVTREREQEKVRKVRERERGGGK